MQTGAFHDTMIGMKRLWLLFAQVFTVVAAALAAASWMGWTSAFWSLRASVAEGPVALQVAPSREPLAAESPLSLRSAAEKASLAVVSINTRAERPLLRGDAWQRFFFGIPNDPNPQTGLGSGVIVSAQGHVLTNHHVVDGAQSIEVVLSDGRKAVAKVLGTDPETDLAVLDIDLPNLPVMTLDLKNPLHIGDSVLAIGNPFGVGQTVTSGIVSALGRSDLGLSTFENFIQTDAAINPGNSGGALVNVHGELVGINTAIYSRSGGSMGIGFAIPVSLVQQVLVDIVKEGHVTRGWLGVEPRDIQAEWAADLGIGNTRGVLIAGVLEKGPAEKAGLRAGDVVTHINAQPVPSVSKLLAAVAAIKPGESVQLEVKRKQQTLRLQAVAAKRPTMALSQPPR